MANFNKPDNTTNKADVLDEIYDRTEDVATMSTPTNPPTGYIRWNDGTNKFEKYSGSSWGDLSSNYNITVDASKILSQLLTVDGSGSGLDADKLDNLHASSFMRTDTSTSTTGALTIGGACTVKNDLNVWAPNASSSADIPLRDETGNIMGLVYRDRNGLLRLRNYDFAGATTYDELRVGEDTLNYNGNEVALLGKTPQNNDNTWLHLSRTNTSPSLYVNQYGTGSIARFFKGSNSSSTTSSSSNYFEIKNDGGFTSTGDSSITGSLNLNHSNALLFEGGDHRITYNDGGGNFNIRVGHYYDNSTGTSKYSDSGSSNAIHMNFSHENSVPSWELSLSPVSSSHSTGDTFTFDKKLEVNADGDFKWDGKNVLLEGDVTTDASTLDGHDSTYFQRSVSDINGIEITSNLSGNRSSYIDFHSDDVNTDYSARIIRNAGENGSLGIVQDGDGIIYLNGGSNLTRDGNTIWHNGNDAISTGTNGYCKLPNGLLIQWGSVTSIAETGTVSGSFPITFPSACLSMVLTLPSQASTTNAAVWRPDHTSMTASSYVIQKGGWSGTGGGGSQTAQWIAIGY